MFTEFISSQAKNIVKDLQNEQNIENINIPESLINELKKNPDLINNIIKNDS
jgi:hypothetical protein